MLSSSAAVVFDHVSKTFVLHRSRTGRSFQETLIQLFRRNEASDYTLAAVEDVSFSLEHGKTYGFIGANGAGKSTALKLIARIIEPSSGSIAVNGQVGALLELGAGFHPELTGRENVYLNGAVLGFDRDFVRRNLDEIVAFAELDEFIDMPVKHYSSGMYVRLGFSVAVHTQPQILLIDEVLAVGDTSFQQKCLRRIGQMRGAGVTIILVSHDVSRVQSLCEEVLWFEKGALVAHGGAADVSMAYLRKLADAENRIVRSGFGDLSGGVSGRPVAPKLQPGPASLGRRWGSGRIRIDGVKLMDELGRPTAAFLTGEVLEVELHFSSDEVIEEPVFGLAIHNQNGQHVTGPNTRFGGLEIGAVQGEGTVKYRVDALPLLEGVYDLSVSAHHKDDVEMYDYQDRLYTFRVYPGKTLERFGTVSLGGSWAIEGGQVISGS